MMGEVEENRGVQEYVMVSLAVIFMYIHLHCRVIEFGLF